ncbi:MAG: ATP-dependent endonuclease [Candidatus Paceibacteria bacterium]
MKYTSFHIKNYKGIEDLELDLARGANHKIFTLVGLNESGKTTILEALNFFQNELVSGQEHAVIPKSKKGNFNDAVSVSATLELDTDDERLIKAEAKKNGFRVKEDALMGTVEIERRYTFSRSSFDPANSGVFWTTNILGSDKGSKKVKKLEESRAFDATTDFIQRALLPPIIYYPNFLTKFPQRIYLQPRPNEDDDQGFYREVLQDVLDSLGAGYTIDAHLVARIHSGQAEDKASLDVVLNKVAAKITTTVFKTWEELFASRGKRIVIEKGVEPVATGDPAAPSRTNYPYIDIKLQEGSDEYSISERSLGFTWFFSFLLFTEFRKDRVKDRGEILFLIDEPASNLHSTAQAKLLHTFERIVSKSKLIYTTHSHHLINPEWLEGAYIVKNKAVDYDDNGLDFDALKTDITATPYKRFAAEHPDQHTYFQPILDTLDYQPSNLELVPEIVIVEGKNDFYTFKYVHDYLLTAEQRRKLDLHFYPGNGAGKNDKAIRLYVAWGRKFSVLVDGDTAGRSAKTKYEEEIGPAVNGRCLPLNEINPRWRDKTTEDLFSSAEKMKIIKTVFPKVSAYTKSHFNEAMQNLISTKTTVVLSQQTLDRFVKIFERVRVALDAPLI